MLPLSSKVQALRNNHGNTGNSVVACHTNVVLAPKHSAAKTEEVLEWPDEPGRSGFPLPPQRLRYVACNSAE